MQRVVTVYPEKCLVKQVMRLLVPMTLRWYVFSTYLGIAQDIDRAHSSFANDSSKRQIESSRLDRYPVLKSYMASA